MCDSFPPQLRVSDIFLAGVLMLHLSALTTASVFFIQGVVSPQVAENMWKIGLSAHEVFLGIRERLSGNSMNIFGPARQTFLTLCQEQTLLEGGLSNGKGAQMTISMGQVGERRGKMRRQETAQNKPLRCSDLTNIFLEKKKTEDQRTSEKQR